jgi:hypothetical protein
MGNKSTFVLLFFVFGLFQLVGISSAHAAIVANYCTGENFQCSFKQSETLCITASRYVGACTYAPDVAGQDNNHDCIRKTQSTPKPKCPSTTANTCSKNNYAACKTPAACKAVGGEMLDGVCTFPKVDLDEVVVRKCPKDSGRNPALETNQDAPQCQCTYETSKVFEPANDAKCPTEAEAEANKKNSGGDAASAKCGPNTNAPFRHELPNDANVLHYDCTCKFKNELGVFGTYVAGNTVEQDKANCPSSDKTGQAVDTEAEADATGLACIQKIRNDINACKAASAKSVKACDVKSEKNAETMQGITQISQASQQFMHASAAEQCKNMGLVTGATGYGLSAIQGNCNAEMKSCEDACSDVQQYKNADKIKAACVTAATEDATQLQEEATELASVMGAANEECVTKSEQLLKQVGTTLNSMVQGYSAATRCENQVSSQAVLTQTNLNTCIASPNAAGCPVNCISNPTNAQCTCLSNPSAAGCQKGAGAELAGGNPNGKIQYSPISSSGGIKPSAGGGGGGSELDLYVDDEGNPIPVSALEDGGNKGSMFGQAAAAGGGGGGGTSEGAGAKAKGSAAGDDEDKGLFGGMFQSLKSAAGSLFGGGSGGSGSASKKAGASKDPGFNAAGLKPVSGNKNLRGLASNGNICFVDAKGTRVCFGTKNEDIWMKMQKQYSLQYNTFITDK